MNFLVPLALAAGLFVALPILAHALFRGPARAVDFPAAHLVPEHAATAQKRSRLEDRGLLGLRVLLLLALAVLGAAPFVQCSRLSLARPGGGSIAVALVVDDSGSMQSLVDGKSRFERARGGALEVLASARDGDAFAVVLAGTPARLVVPTTTDLGRVRRALDRALPSDRSTDLKNAIALGRGALEKLPQPARQIVLFSDFATDVELTAADGKDVQAPLEILTRPVENCALGKARRRADDVTVEVSCTPGNSLSGRNLELWRSGRATTETRGDGTSLTKTEAREGLVSLSLGTVSSDERADPDTHLFVTLTPSPNDALPADDRAEVEPKGEIERVGVRADPETAGTRTGTSTVIELGLRAVAPDARIEPLAVLPDDDGELAVYSALVVDDPAGFSPELQEALGTWLERGGAALFLLGRSAEKAPLGSAFWPLTRSAPRFEKSPSPGAGPGAAASLGSAWDTWTDLEPRGRVSFEPRPDARTLVPFTDGAPLLVETSVGRGVAYVATLPASVDESDFALRPAFLALLDRVVSEGSLRKGTRSVPVGVPFDVPHGSTVTGPLGPVTTTRRPEGDRVDPDLDGVYVVTTGTTSALRFAERAPDEGLLTPKPLSSTARGTERVASSAPLPISREVALAALLLGALELALRVFGRRKSAPLADLSPDPKPSSIPAP